MRSNFRFCALVLAVTLYGCGRKDLPPPPPPPPPPPSPQVTLEIQQSPTPKPGYVTTYGSNGMMYVYRYSGGTDKRGNINVKHGQGEVNILVTLTDSSNFAIKDVEFADDSTPPQLTRNVEPNGLNAHIRDAATATLDAYYAVKVQDNSASPPADIYCDPRIVNN